MGIDLGVLGLRARGMVFVSTNFKVLNELYIDSLETRKYYSDVTYVYEFRNDKSHGRGTYYNDHE